MKAIDVLHIEDNKGDQFLLKEYAELFDRIRLDLDQVETLNEAIQRLHLRTYDLIILDLGLPNGNGIQNLQTLLDFDSNFNILVLTADVRSEIAIKAVKMGANDYLKKSDCNAHILEKTITFCVERHKIKEDKEALSKALNYKVSKLNRLGATKGMYVVRTDLEGNYTFYNKRFQDTFLRGSNLSFIGKNSLDHILSEDHPKTFDTVRKSLEQPGVPQTVELRKPGYLPGTILHTFWEFTALLDHEGQATEVLCTGYDIADVVQKLESQELQAELNQIIIDNSSDLILTLNEDAQILSASPSALDLLGYNPNELIGKSFFHFIEAQSVKTFRLFLDNKSGQPSSNSEKIQYQILHQSGQSFWVQSYIDKHQSLRQNSIFILITRLIEDERRLLHELLSSKEEYKALYEASPGSILITEQDSGKIIHCNKEFTNLFGYQSQEIIGKTTVEIGLWKDTETRIRTFGNLIGNKSNHNLQVELFTKGKEAIPCLIQLGIIQSGSEKRMISVILDNRELYQQNQKLKKAELELNKANRNLIAAQKLAKVGNWFFDYDTMEFHWSHGMAQIFQFNKLGKKPETIFDLLGNVANNNRKDFINKYRLALKNGRRFKQVIQLAVDGKTKYIELSVYPKKAKNKVSLIEGVCRDITILQNSQLKEKKQSHFFKKLTKVSLKFVACEKEEDIHKIFKNFVADWLGKDHYLLTSSRIYENGLLTSKIHSLYNPFQDIFKDERAPGKEFPVNTKLDSLLLNLQDNLLEIDPTVLKWLKLLSEEQYRKLLDNYPNHKSYIYRFHYDDKIQGICFLSFLKGVPKEFAPELFNALGNQMNSALLAVHTRKQLRRNSLVLNNALAGAMAGVWRCDIQSKDIHGDSHYCDLIRSKELYHKISIDDSLKRIHPDDVDKVTEAFQKHIAGESKVYQAEMRYKCFDGKYRWFEDTGSITKRDKQGNPLEIIGIRSNTDERQQREEQLFLFQNVLNNARDGILITDNNSLDQGGPKILYANKAIESITGFSRRELIGKSPKILQGPDTEIPRRKHIANAIRNGQALQIEITNYTKKGKEYLSSLNILPVKDEHEVVTHYISLQRDITSEKKKDEAYHDLLTRLELAISANEIGVWDYDLDKGLLVWDDSMHKIYGKPKTEFENKLEDWSNALYPDDAEFAKGKLKEAIENGSDILSMRFRIQTNIGVKHINTRAKIIRDSNGIAHRLIGLNWDITQLASYEQELATALNERENILSSVNEGFISVSKKLKLNYINAAASRILGMDPNVDPNLFSIHQLFPYTGHKGLYDCFDRCINSESSESLITYHNSNQRWLDISIYPQENGLSMFIQDITELRKRQADIELIKQNNEALINTTQDHMWSIDRDYKILSANNNYLNYLGELSGETVKLGDSVIIKVEEKQRFKDWLTLYDRALAGEEITRLIEEDIDGEHFIFSVHLYPILNSRKAVTGVACYSYDATERLNYLRRIERQNKSLQEIAWLQSHVLRAPLARIMGLVNLFDLEEKLYDKETQEYLKHIMESAKEMDDVVRDITQKTKDFEKHYDKT